MNGDNKMQETQATNQTSPTQTPANEAGAGAIQQPRRKKKLIIAIVSAVLLVVIAGGAVFGYMWYQNPEKMVADAFSNMAKSESVIFNGVVEATDTSGQKPEVTKLTIDGKAKDNRAETAIGVETNANDYDIKASGNVVFAGDDGLFFKISNVQEIVEAVAGKDAAQSELYAAIIEKTNDKWIKLDADSNESFTREYEKQRKCVNTVAKNYNSDPAQQRQLTDAYKNNRLFKVEKTATEAIDGVNSHKFVLQLDESKVDGFVAALKKTDAAKAYNDCFKEDVFKEMEANIKEANKQADSTFAVWVSNWSHEFTQIQLTGKDDNPTGVATIKLKFNEPVNINTPKDAVPVKDIMDDITQLIFAESLSRQSGRPVAPSEIEQDLILTQ